MIDISKAILFSPNDAFKNNNIYTGKFTISGSVVAGTTTKTFTIPLNVAPDLTDVVFNGPTSIGLDPRPSSGWFKEGQVWVLGNGGVVGANYPTNWRINTSINGNIMTVTAMYVQTFIDTITLTATDFSYRLVDYSAL